MKELDKTIRLEGGYVDSPNDSGGATKFGLSLRYMLQQGDRNHDGTLDFDLNLDGKIDAEDVKLLTREQVEIELVNQFFSPLHCFEMRSIRIRWKVFDIGVNCGVGRAAKMLQRVVGVKDDGIVGSQTLQRLNNVIQSGIGEHCILEGLVEEQVRHYVSVVVDNPKQLANLRGWINRAFDKGKDLL